jgi:UDP-2,4-diacetamido-2,4,6-trideoxy-beta-L-altropyranose hydrolase
MKNNNPHLNQALVLIYANSSTSIGNGHVLRQLALAQQLKDTGHQVVFIYHQMAINIEQKLSKNNFIFQRIDQGTINEYVQEHEASLLVIDDYNLSNNEKNCLKKCPIPIVVFDDNTDNDFIVADMIINAADNATNNTTRDAYIERSSSATLLLGSKFRLIRSEFINQRKKLQNYSDRSRFIVTMGGTDVAGLTYSISKNLLKYDSTLPLDIIIGNIPPVDEAALVTLCQGHKHCRLHKNVENMAALVAEAGMAITAAGGTLYELATLGVPSVAICVSKNQLPAMKSPLLDVGFLVFDFSDKATEYSLVSMLQASINLWLAIEKRQQMFEKLLDHYDGHGAHHILSAINNLRIANAKQAI